ncbi:helix-turn-helix transcriptional regulator [bacterium]|nr:helix-turn-helix transcriptional regulator [bacterium]
MKPLTKFEEILLLAIWRLKDDAYGVKIRQEVMRVTGENLTYGTLYSALDQLTRKLYATKTIGEPTAERGGRRKIYYTLSPDGSKALRRAQELTKTLWNDVPDMAFE